MSVYARVGTFCQDNFGEITYVSKIFSFSNEEHMDRILEQIGLESLQMPFERDLPGDWCQVDLLETLERMTTINDTDKYIEAPKDEE